MTKPKIRPPIIDSDLLPVIKKAEEGCFISQGKLAHSYSMGINGTSKERELARHYFKKMLLNFPKPIPIYYNPHKQYSYEEIFQYLGHTAFNDDDFNEAIKYYRMGLDYMKSQFSEEKAEISLKESYPFDEWLEEAQYWQREYRIDTVYNLLHKFLRFFQRK